MKINMQQRRKKEVRGGRIDGVRGMTAGFFTGVILCSLLSGFAGTACAVEARAEARTAVTAEQKQTEAGKGPEQAGSQPAETVVARVNGAVIPKRSLDLMTGLIQTGPVSQETEGAAQSPAEVRREKALERLIFQELVYQKAREEGFNISKEDLAANIDEMKERAGGEEAYRTYLKGVSRTEEEMRASVERSLIMERLYKREISDKVVISEEMLKAEYERNRDKFAVPEMVMATDVIFFLDVKAGASFKKAEEVRAKIVSAPDKGPWALEPDGTFIVRDIEVRKDKDGELYREARKLREGELSNVFRADDGLHIIQLKKYVPEKTYQFEQVRSFLDRKLRAAAQLELARKWELELKKGAAIEIMPLGNEK